MSGESTNGKPGPSRPQENTRPLLPIKPTSIWLIVGVVGLAFFAAGVGMLSLITGRRIPELTPVAFDLAQARWQSTGPDSYDMRIEIRGNRPGEVQVEVRHGVVTRMTRDGRVPTQRRTWSVWSVSGMFDTIEREMELADDPEQEMKAARGTRLWLRCLFDPHNGVPLKFHRAVFGGGPEVYWRVTNFEPK